MLSTTAIGLAGPKASAKTETKSQPCDNKNAPSFRDIVSLIVPTNREKAIKQAITNAIAILLVIVILAVLVAIHIVLTPFLRPLVLALLFGSVLHPLKRSLSLSTDQWLNDLKTYERPILIGLFLLPFDLINNSMRKLASTIYDYRHILLVNFALLPLLYLVMTRVSESDLYLIIESFWYVTRIFSEFVNNHFTSHPWMILSMTVAHMVLVVFLPRSRRTRNYLKLSSLGVSITLCIQLVSLNITLGFLLLCFIIIMVFIGMLTYNASTDASNSAQPNVRISVTGSEKVSVIREVLPIASPSPLTASRTPAKVPLPPIFQDPMATTVLRNRVSRNFSQLVQSFLSNSSRDFETAEKSQRQFIDCSNDRCEERTIPTPQKDASDIDLADKPMSSSTPIQQRQAAYPSLDKRQKTESQSMEDIRLSSVYLYGLVWVFVVAQFWLHPGILYAVAPFILSFFTISWLCRKLHEKFTSGNGAPHLVVEWLDERQDVIIHPGLKHVYRYLVAGDRIIIDAIQGYVDYVSSAFVIIVICVMIVFTTLYLSFQIYTESVYLIDRIGQLVNSTMVNNPDLKQLFPDGLTGVNSLLDGAVNNTYRHGREWIKTSTRQLLDNAAMENFNKTQSKLIEKQVVEFWDRAFVMWLKNRNGTLVGPHHQPGTPYDWNRLFDALQTLNLSLCVKIIKQNLDTLVNISLNVLTVVRGNINLVLGAITAALSIVFVGGNALVNFFINLIIFTTALFYLLCASHEHYKPFELLSNVMPAPDNNAALTRLRDLATGSQRQLNVMTSVTESVNAVFVVSFKMMSFHGLFTWLLHSLFELEVVYIPSVISAVCAMVPFISPYWASMPAVIDLWLGGQRVQSILMFLLATLPSSFVTSAFYSEIKGAGHPYLTGLALAGGVVVWGPEGVLFGPILLVVIKMLSVIVIYFIHYK